ncbi:MAG: oligosaccharide flippase family protein, partial [Actinomycetota bacterium]
MLRLDRPVDGTTAPDPGPQPTPRRTLHEVSDRFWSAAGTPRVAWGPLRERIGSWRPNLTALLILLIGLTFVIPSRLVLRGPLGAAGRPSLLVGLALFVVWLLMFLAPRERRRFQPVRLLVGAYVAVWLASVATAYLRGLTSIEGAGIERFFLITLSLAGIALVMADHLPDRDALDRVLQALVAGAAFMGFVGFVQFQLGFDLTRFLELPGLRSNAQGFEDGLAARGDRGFSRAVGTAAHSIEFAVLSAMVLPLAIHFALGATDTTSRRRRWALAALVAVGIPFSLSRSGIIAAVAVLLVLLRVWNGHAKLRALAVLGVSVVLLRATVPGLVGTFVSFFANAGSDRSVTGRTQDYELVEALFVERPWLGLGGGTFRPEQYFILDNYLLNALVSTGILGLLTVIALFLGTYGLCIRMTRRLRSVEDRHLAGALAASALAGFAVSITFDSLNFASFATVLFLIVGAFGALWRLRDSRLVDGRELAYGAVTKTRDEAWPGPLRYLHHVDEPLPPRPVAPPRPEPRLDPSPDGGGTFGSALRWSALMNGGRQLATIGISFLLAAQLGPRIFGVVAIATVYVAFVQMILQQGMGAAIIQRRDLRSTHLDTAFWLLMGIGGVLSVASVALSGWWASVNDLPELRDVIWGLTPLVLLRALLIVPDALLRRRLEFRPLALRTNASVILGGLAGLVAAILGAGVWALVIQQLTTAAIEVFVVWAAVDWKPQRRFSRERARELIGFTGPSTLAGFGVFVNARADALITGILLGPVAVGLHRFGARLVDTVVEAVSGSLRAVALPELSRLQDERHAFVARLVGIVGLAAGVAVIPLAALAAAAQPLLDLAGDEWLPAVPALAILAVAGAGRTIGDLIGPVLQSLGRPGVLAALSWVGGGLSAGALVVTGLLVRDASSGDQVIGLAVTTAALYGVVFLGLNAAMAVRYAGVPARSLIGAVRPAIMAAPVGYGAGILAGRAVDDLVPSLLQVAVIGTVAAAVVAAVLWLLDPKVRLVLENGWRRIRPGSATAGAPLLLPSTTGGAHMPRPRPRRTDGGTGPERMLVAIAYHGTRNEPHVLRLIEEYRSMRFDVDIVLLTDEAKLITGVEQRIGAPINDPWSLPFGYQQLFAERRDDYELFVYSEDDTLITEAHVDSFLHATAALPDGLVPGFLRVEEREDGTLSCSTVHNHYHWEPDSALRVGDDVYGVFSNPHSGSFILTGEQLDRALDSDGFLLPPRAGRYDMLVTAATAPYTSCGLRKVICLTRLDEFLLPHLTNKYLGSMGIPVDDVRAQADALVGTLSGSVPTDRLFDPTSNLDDGRWDKRFYEPVDAPLLEAVPADARRVLSVGVGSGALEVALTDRGHEVTGIPLDAIIAVSARGKGIELTSPDLGRALRLLGARRFDAVVFARSLHHFADPAAVLDRILRLVEPRGAVVASFPNLRRHRTQTRLHREQLPVPSG